MFRGGTLSFQFFPATQYGPRRKPGAHQFVRIENGEDQVNQIQIDERPVCCQD